MIPKDSPHTQHSILTHLRLLTKYGIIMLHEIGAQVLSGKRCAARLGSLRSLLKSSDMPIAEIAETLGFNSSWYFSHFFTKATGRSPRAYRSK